MYSAPRLYYDAREQLATLTSLGYAQQHQLTEQQLELELDNSYYTLMSVSSYAARAARHAGEHASPRSLLNQQMRTQRQLLLKAELRLRSIPFPMRKELEETFDSDEKLLDHLTRQARMDNYC